ncbi:hypothetical protein [Polyangium spumosum]|uniref:Uncharacterized protein n=1 Tax=Polyangium spumosum TaxID=889282 RepID=A0A6N7Q6T2_9BACT|nr:hypothetical protein [Polyangium spumosum]MRG98415.1 hypothetical protein [Polyangium spumosum]
MLAFPTLASGVTRTATYLAAVLHALAREEALGRRPKRLLEPGHATWTRFRGRLRTPALVELLLEDAAVTQPCPFRVAEILGSDTSLRDVPAKVFDDWLAELPRASLDAPSAEYIAAQAKRLGLPTRMARADLHKIKPHQHVLELPGTGGQLAHHIVQTQRDIYLQDVFTIVVGTWQELTLAGLVAVECELRGAPPVIVDRELTKTRERRGELDYVIGMDPDKGGFFTKTTLEQAGWFPSATILLV